MYQIYVPRDEKAPIGTTNGRTKKAIAALWQKHGCAVHLEGGRAIAVRLHLRGIDAMLLPIKPTEGEQNIIDNYRRKCSIAANISDREILDHFEAYFDLDEDEICTMFRAMGIQAEMLDA